MNCDSVNGTPGESHVSHWCQCKRAQRS
ncbi:hypothetical protein BLAT2472_70160 [Burkholderia latens]